MSCGQLGKQVQSGGRARRHSSYFGFGNSLKSQVWHFKIPSVQPCQKFYKYTGQQFYGDKVDTIMLGAIFHPSFLFVSILSGEREPVLLIE